jgi:hydrogenase maturation protease
VASTLILGLGNNLRGDDGAGPAVVTALLFMDLPQQIEIVDGGTLGLEIVLLLQGYERVIIVDAADMGLQPGQWRRFTLDTAELKINENKLRGTLHAAGLAEALVLAGALDMLPETLIFYGIQPEEIDWSDNLSAPVQAAIPNIAKAIVEEFH